jgi:hypothetical protein
MGITNYLRENAIHYKDQKSLAGAGVIEFGISRKRVTQAILDIGRSREPLVYGKENISSPENPVQNIKKFKGLSESEIRAKHDLKYIFGQAVRKLEKGLYITDADFIRQCDIKGTGYRSTLDDPEFKRYKGRAGGIVYWSHPESIEKMKNEGILT